MTSLEVQHFWHGREWQICMGKLVDLLKRTAFDSDLRKSGFLVFPYILVYEKNQNVIIFSQSNCSYKFCS